MILPYWFVVNQDEYRIDPLYSTPRVNQRAIMTPSGNLQKECYTSLLGSYTSESCKDVTHFFLIIILKMKSYSSPLRMLCERKCKGLSSWSICFHYIITGRSDKRWKIALDKLYLCIKLIRFRLFLSTSDFPPTNCLTHLKL